MTLLFWLDVSAYMISIVTAMALALTVLGAGPGRWLNRLFALFTLAEAGWAASSIFVRMTLWLGIGAPDLWLELAALALSLMGPFLLMFTVRYVGYRTRWADWAALAGLAGTAAFGRLLFQHQLAFNPVLETTGVFTYSVSRLGMVASALPVLYLIWSMFIFWRERHQTGEPYLAVSVFILVAGFIIGGVIAPRLLIMSLTTTLSVFILGYRVVSRQLLNPLREFAAGLERKVEERTRELIEANQALAQRSAELESLNTNLQQITQRAERRAAQITTGAQIARVATTLLNPDQLIQQVVQLIQERFEYYYVGLFLTDPNHRFAVLHYGTGEAGRIMKEQGHRLEIGEQSMIGWACAHNQARIALDVGQDAVRFANPYLPDTHSEMALPLRAGSHVTGALSVQSTQTAAFDESDIAALQGMADQIAAAIETARLFQQTQNTLQELQAANRLLVREGWQGYLEQPLATRRAEFRATDAPATGPLSAPLIIPLELRGQAVGRLTVRREGEQAWSDEDVDTIKTIALQTVLATDNARLIEQAARRQRRLEAMAQITDTLMSMPDTEGIVAAAVDGLVNLWNAALARIWLVDQDEQGQALFLRASAGLSRRLDGARRRVRLDTNHQIGRIASSRQPRLGTRLEADPDIQDHDWVRRESLQSFAGYPLEYGERVTGVIIVFSREVLTQDEFALLGTLAHQVATAVENQRLYNEAQRRAERERLIGQITTRIRAAGNIQGILETTATELAQTMGVPRAIVRLTTDSKPAPHQERVSSGQLGSAGGQETEMREAEQ